VSDPNVREVGRVTDIDGANLAVGVNYDAVMVGPYRFDKDGQERLAWLLNRAMWEAEKQTSTEEEAP
jgi:hypothetical protein